MNNTDEKIPAEKENITECSPPKRRSARLSGKPATNEPESDKELLVRKPLPFIEYKGAIKYYTEMIDIAEAANSIMEWCDKQSDSDIIPMAFDMEWPFSFQTGPGKASVIQICVQEDCCYVFQLSKLKKLPAALMALLKHPKVRLHGVNIKNDIRKLARDFPETNADVLIKKCIDLGIWCNEVCDLGGRWSLERLTNHIVKLAMDKNKKVRMSKWHVIPLDENQLMYAAIDVYIGQVLYRELERLEQIKKKNKEAFIQENGELAYKTCRALGETFLDNTEAAMQSPK